MQKQFFASIVPKAASRKATGKSVQDESRELRNAVIYCRVSSKEQIEGTSLESQEIACNDYARAKRITILKTFIERGESAKYADRTQLIELIDFCRNSKPKVDALVVWKLDRFARNVGDHFNIKATLMKYGVRVVSVTEPIDTNPEGKLMETILAGFAQFDNDIRAARTVQGMKRKIQEGIFPWKPPLGYRSAGREGAKKTDPDEPNQPLFGLLQKSWNAFASGAYTKATILRAMQSWGVETARGIPMTSQSLDNFLRNPYYAGILVDPWSGEEHPGQHPPMVSHEEFARVQGLIAGRSRSQPHQKEREEFPLRGFARCAMCRQAVTGAFSRGRSKRYAYYCCGSRMCDGRPNYRAAEVHEEFGALLDGITPGLELIKALERRIIKASTNRQAETKSRRERGKAQRARLEQQVQELIRMRAQLLLTDKEFITMKSVLANRLAALTDVPGQEESSLEQIRADLQVVGEPLSHLRMTWNSIPAGFHRRFNEMVLPIGFVIGESRTADLSLFFKVCNEFCGANSHGVAPTGENLNQLYQAIQAFAELFRSVEEAKNIA